MKKILNILILIIFIGILSPIGEVGAQIPEEAKGENCVLASSAPGGFTNSFSCEKPPAGAIGKTCHIVGSSPDGTSDRITFTCQYPPNTVFGTCTYTTGLVTQNIAEWNCISPATWAAPTTLPNANTPRADTDTTYTLLAPLPGLDPTIDTATECAFGKYMNDIISLIIGLIAIGAVVVIVMGGLRYMASDLISSKEAGKDMIKNALLGLLIALGAYVLLFTINEKLVDMCLDLPEVTIRVDLGGEGTTPLNEATIQAQLQSVGITCTKSGGINAMTQIAQSYVNRSTYSQAARNTTSGGKANVDCSAFVSQVYVCAGLPNPGGTTAGIFGAGRTPVTNISADGRTVNGTALRVGDLLGWRQGENGEKNGHVVMYIGNGQVIDAQGSGVGVGVRSLNSDQFKGRIKYIRRAP